MAMAQELKSEATHSRFLHKPAWHYHTVFIAKAYLLAL
jgi:hypothetical protein